MTELKKYEGTIRLMLPGYVKETECHCTVSAENTTEANIRIEELWKKATELRDVRVKEIPMEAPAP